MKEINLTKGYVALVDDEDYDLVNQYSWYANVQARVVYARTTINKQKRWTRIQMHRLIMNPSSTQQVDHIDHNGLNNQKSNLRLCTIRQNSFNKIAWGSSGYKGVGFYYDKKGRKYIRVIIKINGKLKYLGTFKTIEDAARAYDNKAIEIHGEFVNLNLPAIGSNTSIN